jgi:2'-5' RNA ligase
VTLKFLGQIDPALVGPLTSALEAAAATVGPFDLDVQGLGAFPTPTRPRVIWAGTAGNRERVVELAEQVERAVAPVGFPREERAFSPHVTLGRVREPRVPPALADALRAAAGRSFGLVRIEAVSLMRSELSRRGARYSELASGALGGARQRAG